MYQDKEIQISLQENPLSFMGAKLNPGNRWVQLAKLIPWKTIEEKYHKTFENAAVGNPAKSCRTAIGTLIIKERLGLSDRETVEMIAEHPYLQYFIGMDSFENNAPFAANTITMFRQRLTTDMMADINRMIIDEGRQDDEDSNNGGSAEKPKDNEGTLILDATCAPADIHFPTDVSLLNEGREKLEEMIDTLHDTDQGRKPRTYRENARKEYLKFVRNRKPKHNTIRKAIRQQLGYVRRDLGILDKQLGETTNQLTRKQNEYLETIRELYRQQEIMHRNWIHRVPDRIVSIHRPWVRPIVRGKVTADVEFGAKICISMTDGYAAIERLDWDAYNETVTLTESIENYKNRTGHYPERVLADKIYRTRDNLNYCTERDIRFNGPKLGRPPKDKAIYTEQKRLEKQEAGERNAVEGKFGEAKRCYGLGRVMARLKNTSEIAIHMTFIVMNLEKRLRDIIVAIYRWICFRYLAQTF